MRIRFFFAWYDFWVGAYYDRDRAVLYVCPLPCCVFEIWLPVERWTQEELDSAEAKAHRLRELLAPSEQE